MHRSLQIRKQAARAKLRKLRPMGLLRLPRAYHPDAMPFELTSYCLKTLNDFKWQSYTEKHKAAIGLSCVACFERSVGIFADRGASKIMMFQESLAFDLIKCSYIKTSFYVGTVMLSVQIGPFRLPFRQKSVKICRITYSVQLTFRF